MQKRPHYLAVGLLVLVTLVLLNLPSQTTARLKLAIGSLFLPLFGLAGSAHQTVEKAGNTLLSRADLLKEIQDLRRENDSLRLQQMQGQEALNENARLRRELAWPQRTAWSFKLARVIVVDPANWWRDVEIDLGSRDDKNLRPNLPVLTADGLVGRILSVGQTRSQVVLLGDPNCKVSARVGNDTGAMGVITGADPLDHSLVTMSYLPKTSTLKPGQSVLTSGEGGLFPRGIPIGRIVDTRAVDYGLYAEARVKLSANLNALEEVMVVFP
jgi:rod shape-determining protein MreC